MPGEGRANPTTQSLAYSAMVSKQVDSVFSRWRGAMEQSDPRAIAQLYTKNAVLLLGDSVSLRGRKELQQLFTGMGRVDEIRTTSIGFAASNEVAVEDGFMTVIFDLPNGGTRVVHGLYSITFRRQDLGDWLIELQSLGLPLGN